MHAGSFQEELHIMKRFIYNLARAGILGVIVLLVFSMSSLTAGAQNFVSQSNYGFVLLRHTPHGSAKLIWSPRTQALTVTISLQGLQANTSHPAHIHTEGPCPGNGPILYALNDVVANAAGNAISITTLPKVAGGIAATGWYINVHSGPTLNTPAEALPVTCGNVINQQTSTMAPQMAYVMLQGVSLPNQNVYGFSSLMLAQNILTVRAMVFGLVPGSSHAIHIHAGSCENQVPGNVLYTLETLTADAHGIASSVTIIPNVTTIPTAGWYINVHFGTDLSTQTGYDPIDCGNVMAS
jgi:Cu/Zn superoxide dismutase